MSFIVFFNNSDGHFSKQSRTVCANLIEVSIRKHFCETILNLNQWFKRRCRLKIFINNIPCSPLSNGAKPFVQFSVEGIIRNISAKVIKIWTSASG